MNKKDQIYFPSKILFFGEYTVTVGSDAIAMPFEKFSGSWEFDLNTNNNVFYDLLDYLNKINWSEYKSVFYYKNLVDDLNNGLFFNSNIKTGFGAGSSGALCAGLFDRYFSTEDSSIKTLNTILARIESYFHGVSSGIDPLVSYLNKAVKTSNNGFEVFDKNIVETTDYCYYLLDSNISRSTKKYVNIFNEKLNSASFINEVLNPLVELNNQIVSSIAKGDEKIVFDLFNKISNLQFIGFKEMIIPKLHNIWDEILPSKDISIKLCGAGGGGYYLIMAKKELNVHELEKDFDLIKV